MCTVTQAGPHVHCDTTTNPGNAFTCPRGKYSGAVKLGEPVYKSNVKLQAIPLCTVTRARPHVHCDTTTNPIHGFTHPRGNSSPPSAQRKKARVEGFHPKRFGQTRSLARLLLPYGINPTVHNAADTPSTQVHMPSHKTNRQTPDLPVRRHPGHCQVPQPVGHTGPYFKPQQR
jgi:hypothetical protein